MSPRIASVLAAAESLSVEERRELVELLLEGLNDSAEPESAGLTEAWREEIARRSAEFEAGQAETVSWQDVQQRWQARRVTGG